MEKMNVTKSKDSTETYNKSVITLSADLFENIKETCCKESIIDPIHIIFYLVISTILAYKKA